MQVAVLGYRGEKAGLQRHVGGGETKWGQKCAVPEGQRGGPSFPVLPQIAPSLAAMDFPGYRLFSLAQQQFPLVC